MDDDLDLVDTGAVAGLRATLLAGAGIEQALWRLESCYPSFWLALFTGVLQRWFGPGCDVRKVTAFTARVARRQAEAGVLFDARQAEALIRVALGEVALVSALC